MRVTVPKDTPASGSVYNSKASSPHCFKIFEKIKVNLLYWFAAQQQTSTFKRQKFGLFYLKFSAEFNELTLNI